MKIENTEFECDEYDCIALDYYMGEGTETVQQWCERVWSLCNLYKKNDGKWDNGKPMPIVYANDPFALWGNKKKRRRAALANELLSVKTDEKDFKNKEMPTHLDADAMLQCKAHPRYKKQSDRFMEEKDRLDKKISEIKITRQEKAVILKDSGMSKEAIVALSPDLADAVNELIW
jgi:catalase (peroxidase I)